MGKLKEDMGIELSILLIYQFNNKLTSTKWIKKMFGEKREIPVT